MDLAGIEASVCFPNFFSRFCGQTFTEVADRELGLACLRAYNDWAVEEWAGEGRGRLYPACIVPLWDPYLAGEEVRRCAARGIRAVSFTELPARLGLPGIQEGQYWDPFFAACDETSTVVCLHVGSSSALIPPEPGGPLACMSTLVILTSQQSMVDYLWSGVFERFSNLKIVYSEGEIGWIPCILERSDRDWHRNVWGYDRAKVPRPPSEYYRDHIFGCFIDDQHGIDSIEAVGEDNVMFESDYPHVDTNWPDTQAVAARHLARCTPEIAEKIMRTNAIRVFRLDLA
jgi:predicted TIM-barrel fold metal-dependent hydrolase